MDNLSLTSPAPLSLTSLTVNLLLGIILSSVLAWFYTRYGKSLSNRASFAQTLPTLTMTTVLVISVVKSSLALSLGLVGALSIVRFRTAIKEPEELVYLFMALAIGLGMGADQRLPTLWAALIFMGFLTFRRLMSFQSARNNLYLNVLAPVTDDFFGQVNQLLLQHATSADLRRLDRSASTVQATYLIACPDDMALISLMDALSAQFPDCEFSFVEQDNTLGG